MGGAAATAGGAGQPTTLAASGGMGGSASEPGAGGQPPIDLGGAPPATGGAPACADRQVQSVAVDADSWIDLAEPGQNHVADNRLNVVAGAAERRALFRITLPAAVDGGVLDKATFTLQLARNMAAAAGPRSLVLRRLKRRFVPEAVTWNDAEAALAWTVPGGDLGAILADSTVPLGFEKGSVSFDLTARLEQAPSMDERTIALVVLEQLPNPAPTAQLAFASSEAAPPLRPVLTLEYCVP